VTSAVLDEGKTVGWMTSPGVVENWREIFILKQEILRAAT
jgi:hypothetical protein